MAARTAPARERRIHITERDLREGTPGDINACAVSRAVTRWLKRTFPKLEWSEVGVHASINAVGTDRRGERHFRAWPIGSALGEYMRRFDRGDATIGPRSFILRRPYPFELRVHALLEDGLDGWLDG